MVSVNYDYALGPDGLVSLRHAVCLPNTWRLCVLHEMMGGKYNNNRYDWA